MPRLICAGLWRREMFGQFQPLHLIAGARFRPIKLFRRRLQSFVDKTADHLTVIEDERHLMGAHLQNRPRPGPRPIAETGVEKPRIMNPELAHQGVIGHHLGGCCGGDADRFR